MIEQLVFINRYVESIREYLLNLSVVVSLNVEILPDVTELQRQTPGTSAVDRDESRVGALTLLVYSTMALFVALLLPALVSARRYFTMRHLWITVHGVFELSILGAFVIRSATGTVLLFGAVGFSWVASVWIPYAPLGADISSPSPPRQVFDLVTTKIAWTRKSILVAMVCTAVSITTCHIDRG